MNSSHHVVVLGASPKPARYAHQAQALLLEHGYRVTPIHPKFESIGGLDVVADIRQVKDPIDTLTLYVGTARLLPLVDDIVASKPKRVIFNPGTESVPLQKALDDAGIAWLEGCTLVMLKTNVFLD